MDFKLSNLSRCSLGARSALLLISLLFAFGFSLATNADEETAKRIEFFENRIRPVLVEHCYECHSSRSKGLKGGLFVDSSKGLRMGGDSGPAITLGDSKTSLLMQAIRYESTEMPPKGKLPDSVIADFAQWIDSGATDPRIDESPVEKHAIDIDKFRSFWSFAPPKDPAIPKVTRSDWPINPIDHFILAELEKRGLRPVAAAEKRALIRRATFDLTGIEGVLPPGAKVSREDLLAEIFSRPEAERQIATILHEACHQIAFNTGLQTRLGDYPLWVSEGIATFFEATDLRPEVCMLDFEVPPVFRVYCAHCISH